MTQSDEMGQNLSEKQLRAIELLLMGKTTVAICAELDLGRQTLYTWRKRNPEFIAEMNRRRYELWNASRERLHSLVGDALDILADDLANGESKTIRQNAAVHILKCAGVYGKPVVPSGPETAEGVEAEQRAAAEFEELKNLLNCMGAGI